MSEQQNGVDKRDRRQTNLQKKKLQTEGLRFDFDLVKVVTTEKLESSNWSHN